jgi:hypothetical protein
MSRIPKLGVAYSAGAAISRDSILRMLPGGTSISYN